MMNFMLGDTGGRDIVAPRQTHTKEIAALKAMPLFAGLSMHTISRLATQATFCSFKRDAFIFRRGTAPTGLYFVLSGSVKLVACESDDRERVIELFGERRFFGEIGVFRLAFYRAWTQAVVATRLLHVPSAAVLRAVQDDHALSLRMLSEMSGRIHSLIESISQAAPLHAHKRIAAYLLEHSETSGPAANQVRLAAPKYAIASMLNMSSEALSRALRKLRDAGLIEGDGGRRIRILDRDALDALLHG